MIPTEEEIQKEIETLEGIRGKIPPRSLFGNDNLGLIDAEIATLKERLNMEQIISRFDDNGETERCLFSNDALCWSLGQLKEKPSEGWRPLIRG